MSLAAVFLISVVVLAVGHTSVHGVCNNYRLDWSRGTGPKKFALGVYGKLDWNKAYNYCHDHCMNLASINSKDEQQAIVDLIKRNDWVKETYWWIGGSDGSQKGTWVWKGTEKPFTYTNWRNYAPTAGIFEKCVQLWNTNDQPWGWKNAVCGTEYFFVCEHNSTYPHDYV